MRLIAIAMMVGATLIVSPAQAAAPAMHVPKGMSNEAMVQLAITTMITTNKSEARCAKKIAYKESRYRLDAKNKHSSARGVWQLLWGKPHWNIFKQANEADRYVQHRYGSWCKALRHHQERNWF